MDKKDVEKYLIVVLLVMLVYLSYLLLKPFITALITSAVFAYLSFPIYKKLASLTNKIIAAGVITILITAIILIPLVSITTTLITESQGIRESGTIQESINKILVYIDESQYGNIIKDALSKFTTYIQEEASNLLFTIPSKLFHFLIIIYATFAFLLVGEEVINKIKKIVPVKNKEEIIKNIKTTTNSIVYGMFAVAILEFIISLIIFKILGTNFALVLALLIGFLAFIPFLGPVIIWAPYAVIEITRNSFKNAIILIVFGIILFLIETFLKSKIIGHHAKLHPVIILIGTIGGIQIMGFIGVVAGPVILSILTAIIESYYLEIKNEA